MGSNWGTGLKYTGDLGLKNGSAYKISYTIVSTVDRAVVVGFDGGQPEAEREKIELTAGRAEELEYEVIPNGAWNSFMFYLGNVDNKNDYGAHDITISDLSIMEKHIQLAPEEKPEETKDNLVKNGDFSEQDENGEWLKDWAPSAANGSVKSAQYKAVFDLTGASCFLLYTSPSQRD